jgi:hypothetical protein
LSLPSSSTVKSSRIGTPPFTGSTAAPGRRADHDHPAAVALLAEPQHGGTHAGARATQVHADDGVEVLVGHLPQHPVTQHARVGDHGVETAVLLDRADDERIRHLGGPGHHRDLACQVHPRSSIS